MKHLTFLIAFLTLCHFISFGNANLSFTLDEEDKIKFISSQDNLFYDTVAISENKAFDLKFKGNQLVFIEYNNAIIPLYLEDHDKLNIDFTVDEETPSFSGTAAPNNAFLWKFNSNFPNHFKIVEWEEKNYDKIEIEAFDLTKSEMSFLKEYPKYDLLSAGFQNFIEQDIKNKYMQTVFKFCVEKRQIEKVRGLKNKDIIVDPYLLCSPIFRDMLVYHSCVKALFDNDQQFPASKTGLFVIHKYWWNENGNGDIGTDKNSFNINNLLLKHYAPYLESNLLKIEIRNLDKNDPSYLQLMAYCKDYITEEENEPELESIESFTAVDLNGKSVEYKDILKEKKIIYIDIWASWCGPCRAMAPYAKKLKASLTKSELKNILFLYISLDEQEDKWKKAVEQLGLEGEHWRSKGGWNSEVAKYFGVSGIPRFVIVGKNGKIIDQNAPRPNDPKLTDFLKSLVN